MLNTFLFYLFLQGSNNQPGEVMPRAGAVSSKPSGDRWDTGEASKNAGASDILGIVEGGDADPPIQSDEAVLLTLPLPTNHPRMMCVKGKDELMFPSSSLPLYFLCFLSVLIF